MSNRIKMNLTRKTKYRTAYWLGALFIVAVTLYGSMKYLGPGQMELVVRPLTPQPPISIQPTPFPCLNSLPPTKHARRLAVMHGPDWTLKSSIEPKCLPEREVVLFFEEGRYFLPHPATARIRFWISHKQDKVYIRIVESSGSEEAVDSALDLVTNHKCKTQRGKNCYVSSSSPIPLSM